MPTHFFQAKINEMFPRYIKGELNSYKGIVIDKENYLFNKEITFEISPYNTVYFYYNGEKEYTLYPEDVKYTFSINFNLLSWRKFTEEKPRFFGTYDCVYENKIGFLKVYDGGMSISEDKHGNKSMLSHLHIGDFINIKELLYKYDETFYDSIKHFEFKPPYA
jgi:hypothetical protein